MEQAPTICLNMIVRNEAGCIQRCLHSVRPLISYWVICDTGSTDRTCDIIRRELDGIPGELHEDCWRDFSYNRNLGLERARGRAAYHLIMDADFTLDIDSRFSPDGLEADGYRIRFTGDLDWATLRVVSDRHAWRYEGVVHEFLHSDTAVRVKQLPELTVTHQGDGGSGPGRVKHYLELLISAFEKEPTNARYAFYIAQTHKQLGEVQQAMEWYERRILMEGWDEETWYSLYQLARCKQALRKPWPEVFHAYLQAYEIRPWRLEPLQPVCEYLRKIGHCVLSYTLSRPVLETRYPHEDLLFIERPVYQYG